MLSITYPSILQCLQDFDYGLLPFYIPSENRFLLTIKVPKEAILTARLNNEFKVYLIGDEIGSESHVGLITAFFDDHDEPMVLKTPLFGGDEMLNDISLLFAQNEFEVYFFDELNRELMGVKGFNNDFERFRAEISKATFSENSHAEILRVIKRLEDQFAIRDSGDDAHAYKISLGDRLYPDDLLIVDARNEAYCFIDAKESIVTTSLERDVEPGPMQERDIAMMMNRVFDSECIYINPYREDTKKELTDILVVTDKKMLFIQAKDSPNTEDILRRSIERKRTTIRSHIQKASNQLRGALTYARDNNGIIITTSDEAITIPISERQLVGLIVVREIFDDDYPECSAPVLKVVQSLELPAVLLDYAGLHIMTQNLRNPVHFINGLFNMLDVALEQNEFPKPAWSGSLPE